MDIGRLNRRVEILQFFKDRDEYGGETGEWRTVAKVWAAIVPVSGTEQMFAQQVTAEKVVRITMRFCHWLTVLHRIRYGDNLYEIIGVLDNETAHTATILNAKELVSDGIQRKAKESEDEYRGRRQDSERPQGDGGCCSKRSDGGSKGRR
ncbi:MAG: phage head closure protein [Muribaculaceae bacterium]|nr:phage head closure protein [Muribaculaceae bacterium]